MSRRTLPVLLGLLALFLLGVLGVLSTVSFYLAIDNSAYLTELEVTRIQSQYNASHAPNSYEKIPRIIHQTWKTDVLPDRWRVVAQGCKDLMPDYQYMLWTDDSSRKFIEEHYSWFLGTWDGYKYNIQRADAIRYFVLHHYGGIYLDLDVGCLQRMDPLLHFQVILPKTIPVGVSNDLMFAARRHPFMEQTINNLASFDRNWIINYPTVMFSTGPMFVSAQYGLYTSSHPATFENPGGDVRVLPTSLYGKHAKVDEAPHAFFSHHYGSSWHSDDAAFVTFLGRSGMTLVWVGFFVLLLGLLRMGFQARKKGHARALRRRLGLVRYDLLVPRVISTRRGRFTLDVHTSPPSTSTTTNTSPLSSPRSTSPPSPTSASSRAPLLPFSFDEPTGHSQIDQASLRAAAAGAFRRAEAWVRTYVPNEGGPRGRSRSRGGNWRTSVNGITLYLPAMFTPTSTTGSPTSSARSSAELPEPPQIRTPSQGKRGKGGYSDEDVNTESINPPPPYVDSRQASNSNSLMSSESRHRASSSNLAGARLP